MKKDILAQNKQSWDAMADVGCGSGHSLNWCGGHDSESSQIITSTHERGRAR